mgnify:CR=1 FL=1
MVCLGFSELEQPAQKFTAQHRTVRVEQPLLLDHIAIQPERDGVDELDRVERRDALDAHLWTYRDESFLPHGIDQGDDDQASGRQPVLLTLSGAPANGASVRFAVDGSDVPSLEGCDRLVLMFDGQTIVVTDEAGRTTNVVKADVNTSNGVIHVTDGVFLPG